MLSVLPFLAAAVFAMPDTTPAAPPTGDVLIIANQGDNTVHLVDTGSGHTLAVIPSAPAPHEVAVTADGRWAVVTNYGDRTSIGHTLSVIDVSTQKLVRSIDIAPHRRPHGIAFLPGDSTLAVTSEISRAVVLVDFRSGRVLRTLQSDAQGTHMMAVAPGAEKIYTPNMVTGTITALDVASGQITQTIQVGPGTESAALTPDGKHVWAASMGRDTTYVFDLATGQRVGAIATPGQPYRVAVTPDGRRALIPAPALNLLRVVDTSTMNERTVSLPGVPGGAVVSRDGRTAYVPLMEAGQVAVVDLSTLTVTRRLPAGASPDGLAISSFFRR